MCEPQFTSASHTHSCAILSLSEKLFFKSQKQIFFQVWTASWIGLHAYCAGSMVKFKLGWLVKLRGRFLQCLLLGALPFFDLSPANVDAEAEPWLQVHISWLLPPWRCRMYVLEITVPQRSSPPLWVKFKTVPQSENCPNPSSALHYLKHT